MSLNTRVWVARLGGFGFAQGLAQLLGVVAGILIARLLPIEQYAYYALAIAFITAISVVGDSGLGSQVVAIGGRRAPNFEGFGGLYARANSYRRVIALVLSALCGPGLVILLVINGSSLVESVLLGALVIASVFISLTASLRRSALSVHYRFGPIQKSTMTVSAFRAASTVLLVPFAAVGSIVAIASNTVALLWQSIWLGRSLVRQGHLDDRSEIEGDAEELRGAIKRLLPLNVVVVLQNQGTTLLLGALGATIALAQVTAVSRYVMVFGFVSMLVVSVIGPGFARVNRDVRSVGRTYFQLLSAVVGVNALLLTAMLLATPVLLGLLGDNYAELTSEFAIVNVGGAVGSIAAVAGGLNLSRGWLRGSWVMFPAAVLWITIGFSVFDVTTSVGAALLLATSNIPGAVTAVCQAWHGLLKERRDARGGGGA